MQNKQQKDLKTTDVEYFKSFYFSHSLKETQEHFKCSQSAIYKFLERHNIPRGKIETLEDCLKRISKDNLDTFYANHTRQETLEYFKVSPTMLQKLLKSYDISKGRTTNEELANIISKEELENYYLTHTLIETEEYFNVKYNLNTKHRIMSLLQYYGIDKLNLSKTQIVNYLSDKSKVTLHELADALNLQYCNVSHLVKSLGLEDKINYNSASSHFETEVEQFLKALNIDYETHNRQVLQNKQELDFYIPSCKLGIELNGAYWHSSLFKAKNYHIDKSKIAQAQGVRLIHIWDYEWENPEIQHKLRAMLKVALGQCTAKIYARECEVLEVPSHEAKKFISANHLQGYRPAKKNIGLYYQGVLVQIMTFSNSKYNKNLASDADWEIVRECSLLNHVVIGGKNKLFNYFIKKYNPQKVFSYCDFNKFTGKSYENAGMTFIGYSLPDMKWLLRTGEVKNRSPQKNKEFSTSAMAKLFGAGSLKYEYKRTD